MPARKTQAPFSTSDCYATSNFAYDTTYDIPVLKVSIPAIELCHVNEATFLSFVFS
jgi:hypothetical protein